MGVYLGKDKVSTYIKEYTVDPVVTTTELTVSPDGTLQEIYPSNLDTYFEKVTVLGDSYLRPENIRAGVSIYGVAGSLNPQVNPTLQSITINPSVSSQTLYVPNGYDGYGTITVNPVDNLIDPDIIPSNIRAGVNILGVTGTLTEGVQVSGTLDISENGTFNVADYANVYVHITSQSEIPAGYILPSGTRNLSVNGTYDISSYQYVKVEVPVPSGYIQPSGSQTITTNNTYDVTNLSQVVVSVPIPSGYILPSGTKSITSNGTDIDVGNYKYVNVSVAGAKPEQPKSVTPSTSAQTVLPDSGYTLSSVSVGAIPSEYIIPSGSFPITENGTYTIRTKETVVVNVPTSSGNQEIHNFVYSSTEPQNATAGTIWFKPIE